MTLQQLIEQVDALPPDEFEQLYKHMAERRQAGYRLIPGENLRKLSEGLAQWHAQTNQMSEEEFNAIIDEAVAEVRRENAQRRD